MKFICNFWCVTLDTGSVVIWHVNPSSSLYWKAVICSTKIVGTDTQQFFVFGVSWCFLEGVSKQHLRQCSMVIHVAISRRTFNQLVLCVYNWIGKKCLCNYIVFVIPAQCIYAALKVSGQIYILWFNIQINNKFFANWCITVSSE